MTAERRNIVVDKRNGLQLKLDSGHSSITAVDVDKHRFVIAADAFVDPYENCANLFDQVLKSIHFLTR